MGRGMGITVVIVGLLLGGLATWEIWSVVQSTESAPNIIGQQKASAAQTDQKKTPSDEGSVGDKKPPEQSNTGIALAFVVLVAMTILVFVASWTNTFGESMRQPAFVALMAVIALCAFLYIFWYPAWTQVWGHKMMFWGGIICLIMVSFLFTRPANQGGNYFRFAGYAMIAIICVGVMSQTFKSCGKSIPSEWSGISPGFSPGAYANASSVENALEIIAGCESGNGTPGSGRQFGDDGEVIRNPKNQQAVGKWQINLADAAVAKVVKEHNWDVENSETDNKAAAEFLYNLSPEKGGGTAPWTASAACWGPKLTMPGGLIVTLKAPINDFSPQFPVPRGYKFAVNGDGKKYRAKFVGDVEEDGISKPKTTIIDIGVGGSRQKVPGKVDTIRVQSLEKEPVIIKITLTPKT